MWEKFKKSKFAAKLRHAGTSRAVYITVITLLLAISVLITATAISNRVKKANKPNDPKDSVNDPGNDPNDDPKQSSGTDKDASTGDSDSDKDKPDDSKNPQPASAVPELTLPVSGVIAKGYDSSIQVYSATMGDYRIHLGVDMTTKEAAPVYAAADGVVSQIWNDALMGQCLALSHSGDCYTIYKNLSTELPNDISVGATVKSGQQIGTVGNTATTELAEEPHLHMEMTVKGLSVNPLDYFSQQALASLGKDTSFEDETK